MSKIWKPNTVVAAIIETNGKFLIVEETSGGHTVFNQPAGHLDEGESLLNAVVRETLEETAWHFEPEAITGIYRWPNPDNHCTYLRFCFCGKAVKHEPERELDTGIIRAVWLTRDELMAEPSKLRSPMVITVIDDYLAGIRHPLNLITDLD